MGYAVGGLSGLILIMSAFIYTQSERIDALRVEKAQLIVDVKTEKQKSEQFALETEEKVKKITLARNTTYEKQISDLNTIIDKLRKQRSSPSSTLLPATSNSLTSYVPTESDICFNKGELDTAQRESEAEIEEILFQCTKAQINLKCGIDWVQELPKDNNFHNVTEDNKSK